MRNITPSTLGFGTTTTWNGSSWNNGTPNVNMIARIAGTYTTATHGSISCLDLFLDSGTITISTNTYIRVNRNITQAASGVVFNIVNGELALFNKDVDTTSVKLTISRDLEYVLQRLDYRILGNPIDIKTFKEFSPQTVDNRFYRYNVSGWVVVSNVFGVMTPATGYLIRTPNDFSSSGAIWRVTTTSVSGGGKLNSGIIKLSFNRFPTGNTYVAVCNPYSASIDINKFLRANPIIDENELSYWLKSNNATGTGYYNSDEYNSSAYISYFPKLKPFEGFIVAIPTGTTVNEIIFTPDMMVIEEPFDLFSSYHLSLRQSGFTVPLGFCSYTYYKHPVDFTNNARTLNSTNYRLQLNNSVVSTNLLNSYENVDEINLKVAGTVGTLSIQLDNRKGIYTGLGFILEDRLLNVFHNLVAGPYSFTSALENYEDRFYIKIQ